MKTSSRLFIACVFAVSLLTSAALRAEGEAKKETTPACSCGKSADGKACGVDSDCCCTGEKATKKKEKAPEPKKD